MIYLNTLGTSPAMDETQTITRALLAPFEHESKTAFRSYEFFGVKIEATYELDKRTRTMKPINFDAHTNFGVIRCGSSAFTAAAVAVAQGTANYQLEESKV